MAVTKDHRFVSIKQAWINLASDVLLSAIEDARQIRDLYKQETAKEWLLSPAAQLIFESLDLEINLKEWVKADCPILQNDD